jgi:segregation and condensation protein A
MPETAEYKVNLENYYGPLDLLLHLVKEDEVDITGIALARACQQYIAFLSAMEKLDINLSGDFLTLASQLLLIKSRTLAPPEVTPGEEGQPSPEEDEEEDASLDLIRKLLDYKRFKDRARALSAMADERAGRHGRPRLKLEGETEQEPLRNLELWDLVLLYSRVVKSTRLDVAIAILYRDIPLEVFIDKILKELSTKTSARFSELIADKTDRTEMIGTFLAILQLAKDQKVRIEQDGDAEDIRVEVVPEGSLPPPAPEPPPPPVTPADPPPAPPPGGPPPPAGAP